MYKGREVMLALTQGKKLVRSHWVDEEAIEYYEMREDGTVCWVTKDGEFEQKMDLTYKYRDWVKVEKLFSLEDAWLILQAQKCKGIKRQCWHESHAITGPAEYVSIESATAKDWVLVK